MSDLIIDKEFHDLIPSLTEDEYRQLEQNLIEDGCREKLVTWNNIIIDGHNRYRICREHNIHFYIENRHFDNREAVKEWIILNQFGRRNISINQRSILALQLDEIVKAKAKERQREHGGTAPGKNTVRPGTKSESIHTDKELAKTAGVSAKTIQRARVVLKEGTEEQKERFNKGESKIRALYDEIRKPKEEKKSETMPDKQKTKEGGGQKNNASEPETSLNTLPISIRHIKLLVNNFLAEADKYLYMTEYIPQLGNDERVQISKEIDQVNEWYEKFKKILE